MSSCAQLMLTVILTQTVGILFAQNYDTTKIALLGCHQQNNPAPALEYFADVLKPDFAVWLGDNVYADTRTDPQHIQRQLEVLEQKAGFQKLRNTVPFFVTWDDHDYGLNNSGAEYIFKEESKQIFRKFWRVEEEIPAELDGVYYAKIEKLPNGKTIQFLMIDTRYNNERYLPDIRKKDADMLGEKQWRWLEEQLKIPADVRLFVSGQQVLLNKTNRWETWSKVGKSQKRLDELLTRLNPNNLIILTGDQHTAEVLKSLRKMKYKTYEIMACGINQTERPGRAPNRVAGPDKTLHSAPVLELHWDAGNPFVVIKNHDVENKSIGLEYKIYLSRIGVKL